MQILHLCAPFRLVKGKEEENAQIPAEAIEAKVPLVMELLGNEDDDVSGAVTMATHDYLSLLRQLPQLSGRQKQLVKVGTCCHSLKCVNRKFAI